MQKVRTKAITETTVGTLISTSDVDKASKLGRLVTVRELIGRARARFEQVDAGVILYVGQELYELKLRQ